MQDIVFIHGMFLNPRSWQPWVRFFEERGHRCHAPAWPLHEGDPQALRENPPPGLGKLSLAAVVDAMERVVAPLERPILVGHSVGGLIVQILVGRGHGSAGVPICSVAPNRMLSLDWSFFRNSASITNPLKGDALYPMDADGFHRNFANTLPRADSDAAWQRYAMHESRNVLRDCMGDDGKVDLDAAHAPLLFVAADRDEIIPPELCRKNARAYTHPGSRADYVEFENRGHFICGEPQWEEVASHIENWVQSEAGQAGGLARAPSVAASGPRPAP
ncbi:MAG: alpha/beta hydrolase [Gammaproteobacteria bacterium]|nr:alpha/beta hydrolase [Gammaproteobacteria bacterium]